MFLKFAAAGPDIQLSPVSVKRTVLGRNTLPTLSPDSKSKRVALQEPSKKGLKALEKNLQGYEAAVRKGIVDLDKATNDFREAEEERALMRKKLDEKLMASKRSQGRGSNCNRGRSGAVLLRHKFEGFVFFPVFSKSR